MEIFLLSQNNLKKEIDSLKNKNTDNYDFLYTELEKNGNYLSRLDSTIMILKNENARKK